MLGSSPMLTIAGEYYTALQRGTIDGGLMTTYSLETYKMWEVCHQVVNPPLFPQVSVFMSMNLDKWNKLGAEFQKLLLDGFRKMETRLEAHNNIDEARVEKMSIQKGIEFYTLPKEDQRKMWASQEPIWDIYIDLCKKQGLEKEARDLREILSKRFDSQ